MATGTSPDAGTLAPTRPSDVSAPGVLTMIAATGAAAAALIGVPAGPAPVSVVTVWGQTVDLFGAGMYRYDSLFSGAANRGTDVVTLLVVLPLLVVALRGFRRGSLRAALTLTGAQAWLLYVYLAGCRRHRSALNGWWAAGPSVQRSNATTSAAVANVTPATRDASFMSVSPREIEHPSLSGVCRAGRPGTTELADARLPALSPGLLQLRWIRRSTDRRTPFAGASGPRP
jgi:hypothetical protein